MKKVLLSLLFVVASFAGYAECSPAFEWRGIMIDVSRHYIPVSYLYKEIDAMEHFGLNKLHLHLTDAAGWRIEIKSRPRLTEVGAWRTAPLWKDWSKNEVKYSDAEHGFGGYYTQDEMRALVAYAAEKGIDIIPEIEFPGHSEETVAAYPEVGYNGYELDMQNEETYALMRDVLTEIADVFPSQYLHVGGDEAATQNGIQPEGMRRVRDIVRSLGRKMVVWDEALTDEPGDADMVIMVWRNINIARKALELGHEVVICPGKFCYLDKAQDAPMAEPKAAGGYLPVDSVYMIPDPAKDFSGKGRLLGIQANLWTEHVETPEYAEYMIWPRAYAIAELGRNGFGDDRDVKSFHKRALEATAYLREKLNINAFDLANEKGQRHVASMKGAKTFSISYNTKASSSYPGIGDATLCDHRYGGWNNNDGSWQGFIGEGGMDVTVDLGKVTKVKTVSVDFLQSTGPQIYFPYSMDISISDDGVNFTPLQSRIYEELYCKQREDYQQFDWTGKARARYIRVKALPGEMQGWIFCSEITVK